MKKTLYLICAVQIIIGLYAFFTTLGQDAVTAVISATSTLLSLVPLIALIKCIDEIEALHDENITIRESFNRLLKKTEGIEENTEDTFSPEPKRTASGTWKCLKCDTVNKSGTNECEYCGAAYSLANPTTEPNGKKTKISRFVK